MGSGDVQDRALLGAVREMLDRFDPPPGWVVDLAKLSFDLRSIDAELAELVADSLVDEPAVAVRSATVGTEPRMLTFESDDLAVDLELVHRDRGLLAITGQLFPASRADVDIRQPDRPIRTVVTDDLGRFIVEDLPAEPFSLVVRRSDCRPVASQWVTPD